MYRSLNLQVSMITPAADYSLLQQRVISYSRAEYSIIQYIVAYYTIVKYIIQIKVTQHFAAFAVERFITGEVQFSLLQSCFRIVELCVIIPVRHCLAASRAVSSSAIKVSKTKQCISYHIISYLIKSIQFNSIQFNSIQFNSIQFNSI